MRNAAVLITALAAFSASLAYAVSGRPPTVLAIAVAVMWIGVALAAGARALSSRHDGTATRQSR